jgi:hypothetical protein
MSGTVKNSRTFMKQVFSALMVTAVVGMYPLMQYGNEEVYSAVIAGVILSLINAVMGFAVIEFSLRQPYDMFVQIVMGGIAARLFVMTGLFLVLVLVFKFHVVALTLSLFVMYVVFLAIEVVHIYHKRLVNVQAQHS